MSLAHSFLGAALIVSLTACGAVGSPVTAQQSVVNGTAVSQSWFASPRDLAKFAGRNVDATIGQSATSYGQVESVAIERFASIYNLSSKNEFTVFETVKRLAVIKDDSSAVIGVSRVGSADFVTAADRAAWLRSGKPDLWGIPITGGKESIARGSYGFLAKGSEMTFKNVISLPGSADKIVQILRKHIVPYVSSSAGGDALQAILANDYAFLLATAPLAKNSRAAIWAAIANLSGLRFCGTGKDLLGRYGRWICVAGNGEDAEVLIDMHSFSVLDIRERLTAVSPMFPRLQPGAVTSELTFISEQLS